MGVRGSVIGESEEEARHVFCVLHCAHSLDQEIYIALAWSDDAMQIGVSFYLFLPTFMALCELPAFA
ncbi:hypothetical protein VNO80_00088 [Phaseolus coccineus]|uniref:Uncharacterized protein n=1 Tax=Phaseolus coccineus TaxID=3886 RepID=A0AAN9RSD4_PHACN